MHGTAALALHQNVLYQHTRQRAMQAFLPLHKTLPLYCVYTARTKVASQQQRWLARFRQRQRANALHVAVPQTLSAIPRPAFRRKSRAAHTFCKAPRTATLLSKPLPPLTPIKGAATHHRASPLLATAYRAAAAYRPAPRP
jgi:hypothetical protein